MLKVAEDPLHAAYDVAMLDLDGVVYVGASAVPGAPEHLTRARATGMHLAFVTNNASRTPAHVAEHLNQLGIDAAAEDVVTSAQAAAHLLAQSLPTGARVFLLGSAGLASALEAEGLEPVGSLDEDPVAVVSGYDPDLPWRRLMQGAVLIRDGLPWVASNTDLTVPTEYGLGPGHGVQVRMLSEFSGVTPVVAGKPRRPLLDETIRRVGGTRPLMVGDRLDTDIEGANAADVDSLLVMTGVTNEDDLVRAPEQLRPTYISTDLNGLLVPHPVPAQVDGRFELAGWTAHTRDGRLVVEGAGSPDDRLRTVAAAAWAHLDETGEPVR
ncbi:HAD-IIA family hydrolase [Nocardioides sp. JQ2195]|uniref:HAD-IIA family hydrolase n=1 Tax=Nocardioides sp. JQ2195 TaxID=2592334 RepID=UPI00143EC4CB|nr:HAD-IIA family hydrolase [Nocardioides sp. JQ2195]QIX27532.1 HAD-IIA family hydrolase [Nocardioides sp. JQ2195]